MIILVGWIFFSTTLGMGIVAILGASAFLTNHLPVTLAVLAVRSLRVRGRPASRTGTAERR